MEKPQDGETITLTASIPAMRSVVTSLVMVLLATKTKKAAMKTDVYDDLRQTNVVPLGK